MKFKYVSSIVTSSAECVIYAGIIFGWPSLQYVLLRVGYFANLCDFNSTESAQNNSLQPCEERDSAFNLVFTLATSVSTAMLVITGYLFDRYGTWAFRSGVLACYTIGFICLVVSTPSTGWLLYPSMILLTFGGLNVLIVNVPMSSLSKDYRATVTALICGCFDSGSVIFFAAKMIYDSGLNHYVFLYVMAAGISLMWAKTFILMPRGHVPLPLPDNYQYGLCEFSRRLTATEDQADCSYLDRKKTSSFKECLTDLRYLTLVFYYSVINLRLVFYFGSLVNWLEFHFGSDQIGGYINVFNIMLFFGAVVAPLHGVVIQIVSRFFKEKLGKDIAEARGLFASASSTSLLAVLLSVTTLIPQAVYVSFALVLFLRGFVYSNVPTFITTAFPIFNYGKLMGIVYLVGSFVAVFQYGLFRIAVEYDPDFSVINYCFLVLSCATFVHPITLWFKSCKMIHTENGI